MSNQLTYCVFIILIYYGQCLGRDRYQPPPKSFNNDFIANEAGIYPRPGVPPTQIGPQQPNVGLQKPDPKTNKPSVTHTNIQTSSTTKQPQSPSATNKQPQMPSSTVSTTVFGNRDVAKATDVKPFVSTSTVRTPVADNKGKDVKPHISISSYSTPAPHSLNSGKVKDLVKFFDNNGDHNNQGKHGFPTSTTKKMSFSSAVSGTNSKPGGHASTLNSHTKPNTLMSNLPNPSRPAQPFSYSSVVSGGMNKNSMASTPTPKLPSTPTLAPKLPNIIADPKQNNQQGSIASDSELKAVSEDLLKKDVNNAAKLITVNYQGKTTSSSKTDMAQNPLFVIPQSVWNIPTIDKIIQLYDNYERDTLVNEHITAQEKNEENAFLDALFSTSVIRRLMTFFREKGIVTPDPKQQRDFLKQIWFNMYSRGKGKIGSSAFEHVFVSELKNGEVSGLHNWLYFAKEEAANEANYLGHMKILSFGDKGAIVKFHFNLQGADKPVDTMFVGTSPELEVALYTLCFVTRADKPCPLTLGGKDLNIKTHTFRYRSKNMIGSAYPEI